jgi:hypothetical protein
MMRSGRSSGSGGSAHHGLLRSANLGLLELQREALELLKRVGILTQQQLVDELGEVVAHAHAWLDLLGEVGLRDQKSSRLSKRQPRQGAQARSRWQHTH